MFEIISLLVATSIGWLVSLGCFFALIVLLVTVHQEAKTNKVHGKYVGTAIILAAIGVYLYALSASSDPKYKDLATQSASLLNFQSFAWKSFLIDVALYLVIGLVYSFVEARVTLTRMKDAVLKDWNDYKANSKSAGNTDENGKAGWNSFSAYYNFILFEANHVNVPHPTTTINKAALASKIANWTLFWWAYLVNLIFGDLLDMVFRKIADKVAELFHGFVQRYFKNVFTSAQ